MYKSRLKLDQKIEIEIREETGVNTYPSKIAAIEKNNIKVLTPYRKGNLLSLRKGRKITIYFTGEDAVFKFRTEVIDREEDSVPLLVIQASVQFERIQRRDYYRLGVKIEAEYRRVDAELRPIEEYIKTTTINISGGGVRLVLKEELPVGSFLEIILDIPGINDTPLIGKIRELYELPNGVAAGVEYNNINLNVRDAIIEWLFNYQRKLMKKGML